VIPRVTPIVRADLTNKKKTLNKSGPFAVRLKDGDTSGEIICPSCEVDLGVWKSAGLTLIRGFVLVPLFALRKRSVHIGTL